MDGVSTERCMKQKASFVVGFGLAVALCASTSAFGQAAAPDAPGLKVGEKSAEFKLQDKDGQEHTLSSLLPKGKVVLMFYRSADW